VIAGKVSRVDGVVGILATGGLGRGYCDDFSDLDLVVYADAASYRSISEYIGVGFLRYKDIDLDTPVESYERAWAQKSPSRYWSQVMRWDRENSMTLYDSKYRVKSLLEAKLVFPDDEQKRLLRKYCKGADFQLRYNFDTWAKRGGCLNLADCLIKGAEQMVLWIYAKNKKFQPYMEKWPFYHLEVGAVPESKYLRTIARPYSESIRTLAQARDIRDALLDLGIKIGMSFEYERFEEIFQKEEANWQRASAKTKQYLSW
jgi:hypothetical protein